MTLTPKDVGKKAVDRDHLVISKLEKKIDGWLKKLDPNDSFHCRDTLELDTDMFPNELVRLSIMRKYRKAGWKVGYETAGEARG